MKKHPTKPGTATVSGVVAHVASIGQKLGGQKIPVTGYGSHGLGKHAAEVAVQHEPTDAKPMRQRKNFAAEGIGSSEHTIAPILGR